MIRPTLGTLMILVLLIGGGLGWLVHRARTQRLAVAAIVKAGGRVAYGESPRIASQTDPVTRWLRAFLGNDMFDAVLSAHLGSGTQVDDLLMLEVGRLRQLQGLEIFLENQTPTQLTSTGHSQIAGLTGLQKLVIAGPSDAGGFLPFLGDLAELEMLEMPDAHPSDAEFARIGKLTRLRNLHLGGRNLTDAGFAALASCRRLQTIKMEQCHLSDLSPLHGLNALRVVELAKPPAPAAAATTTSLRPLRDAQGLMNLDLRGFPLDEAGVGPISRLPNLASLSIDGPTLTGGDLAELANLPRLDLLQVRRAPIRDLQPLESVLSKVHHLEVEGSPLTDQGIACLKEYPKLQSLSLEGSLVGDEVFSVVANLEGLFSLNLRGTLVGNRGLSRVKGFARRTKLQMMFLDLSGTRVDDAGLADLANLPFLLDLRLDDTAITDAGLVALARRKSLALLSLKGTQTTPEGRARLAAALPDLEIRP